MDITIDTLKFLNLCVARLIYVKEEKCDPTSRYYETKTIQNCLPAWY